MFSDARPRGAFVCPSSVKAEQVSPVRSAAIHTCNDEAAKYLFYVWQTAQFAVYGTCMAKHGQRFD